MTIKKWMAAAALLTTSSAALADTDYVFQSIASVRVEGKSLTGVLVNDTVPTVLTYNNSVSATCLRWIERMMDSPGKYILTVSTISSTYPIPSEGFGSCSLALAP